MVLNSVQRGAGTAGVPAELTAELLCHLTRGKRGEEEQGMKGCENGRERVLDSAG